MFRVIPFGYKYTTDGYRFCPDLYNLDNDSKECLWVSLKVLFEKTVLSVVPTLTNPDYNNLGYDN